MTPLIARTSFTSRHAAPATRRGRHAHRGPRYAWKMRRRNLIARARQRMDQGWYDNAPLLRIAVDRLIDRLITDLAER